MSIADREYIDPAVTQGIGVPTVGVPAVAPDLAASSVPPRPTLLQDVQARLTKPHPKAGQTVDLEVSGRAGFAVRYSLAFDAYELNQWATTAGTLPTGGMDTIRYYSLVIANTCRAILCDGDIVVGPAGQPLTFGSAEVRAWYDVELGADAVRAMLSGQPPVDDQEIVAHAQKVLVLADHDPNGTGVERARRLDPTNA